MLPAPACKNSAYLFRSFTDIPQSHDNCLWQWGLLLQSVRFRTNCAANAQSRLKQLQISNIFHILQNNAGELLAPQP